jgi:hypothetical protein
MSDNTTYENGVQKVLHPQNQTHPAKEIPAVPPQPIREETLALASGEKRTVKVETTEDKEWDKVIALTAGATSLCLDQKALTHQTIAAIAALRIANEKHWKGYCLDKGLKWRKEIKSHFQPVVMWVLKKTKTATGENHTSKASMIAGCLDEFWDIKRPQGMRPDEVAAWLDAAGGYTAVYRNRLDRLRANDEAKDRAEVRYNRYLMMMPLDEQKLPEYLGSIDGEVLISASIDRAAGILMTRSVWQPKGNSFWYSHVDKLVAARPDGQPGNAAQPAMREPSIGNGTDPTAESHMAAQNPSAREPLEAPARP